MLDKKVSLRYFDKVFVEHDPEEFFIQSEQIALSLKWPRMLAFIGTNCPRWERPVHLCL